MSVFAYDPNLAKNWANEVVNYLNGGADSVSNISKKFNEQIETLVQVRAEVKIHSRRSEAGKGRRAIRLRSMREIEARMSLEMGMMMRDQGRKELVINRIGG